MQFDHHVDRVLAHQLTGRDGLDTLGQRLDKFEIIMRGFF